MSGPTVTVICWGCNQSETHPMKHGEEYELQLQELAERGWVRRSFGPSSWDKGQLFCSQECAYESYRAKQAEEWWTQNDERERQVEFQKYCRFASASRYYLVGWVILLGISLATFLLGR